ncbi:hypothetical protein MTO96_018689 [Rhipicephalus appendiculatus]
MHKAPPAWTIEPTSGVVLLGDKLEIVCQSNGYPEPTVTWAKLPARFEEKFKVQTVRRGEAATLQCQAIGDSPLEITWSQDKKRLIFAPVTRYEKFESNTENGVTSELVIPTTDRSDAALYTCVAKNEYGSDERNIKLLVVEVPAQPLDLRILEVWSRKVNVIWSEPYSGNSPINNYIVHYWRDRDGAHRLMEQSVPSSQTSAMISELHPGGGFVFSHRDRRERSRSGSPPRTRYASSPPKKPPPRDTWNGVLKGYYVGYRAAESIQPYSFKTVETVVNGSQEVTLVGLSKSSRYSVIVKAFNAIGSGPPSEALLVRTLDGDVPLPPALTLISSTDSAFKVKWTHSKATATRCTTRRTPVPGTISRSWLRTTPATRSLTWTGGATYKVYLTASNQFGRGSGSEAIIINTTNHGYDRAWVFYKDPSLLVPAASFLIALLVVITVVTVCIKKTKAHKNFEKSLEAEKRQSYGEVTQQQQRYIDVTEKRNRSDYATIQSRRSLSGSYKIEELRSAAPNRGYNTTDFPPKISPFSFPNNASVGQRGTAICTTTEGDRPLTFRWLKNGRRLEGKDGTVTDNVDFSVLKIESLDVDSSWELHVRRDQPGHKATEEREHSGNGTLILRSTNKSDSGEYKCEARNGIGQPLQKTVTVTVKTPPKWIHAPKDQVVSVGESVTMHCAAAGHPPPTITWSKDGGAAADGYGGSIIRIASASKKDEADYKCHISNGVGEDLYKTVRVTVKLSTKISPFIFSKNLLVGERTNVMCSTTSGDQPFTFAWLKDGKPLHQSAKINIASSPQFSTLSIQKLNLGDAGNYTCAVSNAQGTVSYTDALEVKGKTDAKLAADTVNIASVSKTDEGSYTCRVENGVGGPLEKTVQLTVKPPPRILPFAFPRTLTVGETTSVTCTTAAGDESYKYIWLKDGSAVHPGENVKIVTSPGYIGVEDRQADAKAMPETTPASSVTAVEQVSHASTLEIKDDGTTAASTQQEDRGTSSILIQNASKHHQGSYTCRVSNGVGRELSKTVSVKIKQPGNEASKTQIATASGSTALIVPKTAKDAEGKYICEADNTIGAALKKIVFVKVKSPPVWTSEPQDVSAVSGSNVTAQCTASGSPPPKITWTRTKDGGSTTVPMENGRLIIHNVRVSEAGTYSCRAENGVGSAIEKSIRITISEPPKVIPFAFDKALSEGQNTVVTCTIREGSKPVQLQWLKDGHEVVGSGAVKLIKHETILVLSIEPVRVADSGNYTCVARNKYGYDRYTSALQVNGTELKRPSEHRAQVLQNGTLVIRNATSEDSGKYSCLASNGIGTPLTKTVSVLVKNGPKIQPFQLPARVKAGDKVSATCNLASGTPPVTFSWHKDGSDVTNLSKDISYGSNIMSVLAIPSASLDSQGNYTCRAANAYGSDSHTVQLKVENAPVIQPLVFPSDVVTGVTTKLLCTVQKGTRPLRFAWIKDGASVSDGVSSQDDFSLLSIDPVTAESAGNYTCVVSNAAGTDRYTSTLEVKQPSQWIEEPRDISAAEGSEVRPHVRGYRTTQAHRYMEPVCLWSVVCGESETPVPVRTSNGSVSFVHVTKKEEGRYACFVDNGVGKPLRKVIRVAVNVPAKFTEKHSVVTARRGENARLVCDAQGDQPLTVAWSKGVQKIDRGGNSR